MYLMYCDETNLTEQSGIFFVYGGIAVDSDAALELSREIDELRAEHGIPLDFPLKFNPGPPGMGHQEFIHLKQTIIELAGKYDCQLFTSLILHDIATSPDEARRNEINRICYNFDCFLYRPDSHGLVLIDRFTDKKIDHHLREKFSVGLTGLPYSAKKRLNRIIGFHYVTIGQSHLCSVIDIVLGSFRFAVNSWAKENQKTMPTAKKLLGLLAPLFFRDEGKTSIPEISLFFSPKIIKADKYRKVYEGLHAFMMECGIELEQPISDVRRY